MIFEQIKNNLSDYGDKTAFVINDIEYTYSQLLRRISMILKLFERNKVQNNDIIVIYTANHLDTYASIIATFFSGATFVPINSLHPIERNNLILNQLKSKLILSANIQFPESIITHNLADEEFEINLNINYHDIAYILFTSGSTGIPKGVKISYQNINSFISDFCKSMDTLNHNDRFLQIYDLTFDASLHCYLLPLYLGASIYTVIPDKIKFLQAYKLMEKYNLSFTKFPPSVLSYLKPYFNKINLKHLKYSLMGGESLHEDIAKLWSECIPNAQLKNVYGPTEATINTHIFDIDIAKLKNKTSNGIISIGKVFGSNKAIIIDENINQLGRYVKGELCLGGNQITPGYLNNDIKNKEAFFMITIDNQDVLFYKTGDLAYIDDENDFIFCGRKDNQIQIQGYRVELAEIENAALLFGKSLNYAAIAIENEFGNTEVFLFTEKFQSNKVDLFSHLRKLLPGYMIPSKIIELEQFPATSSGKINRNELKKYL
jgi:amino acid adenylation domain-containing protein